VLGAPNTSTLGRKDLMRHIVLAALILMGSSAALAESVGFRVYALQPDGSRKLLAEGSRDYSPAKDIEVITTTARDGSVIWSKRLHLVKGYEFEARFARTLDGFGLAINERDNRVGFSWNWFERTDSDVVFKLRGSGRLKAFYTRGQGYVELAGVEFLDDIILHYTDDTRRNEPGKHTHEIVIAKGSIFRFAP
jgi:hypothetical protein